MTETNPGSSEATLYVCRNCGDGFETPTNTAVCPECGGTLRDTTHPHD